MVSTEENGKLKTYKTYRDLDIEYIFKKEEKSRQKKLRTLTQLKKVMSLSFHRHASLTRRCISLLLFFKSETITYSHYRIFKLHLRALKSQHGNIIRSLTKQETVSRIQVLKKQAQTAQYLFTDKARDSKINHLLCQIGFYHF